MLVIRLDRRLDLSLFSLQTLLSLVVTSSLHLKLKMSFIEEGIGLLLPANHFASCANARLPRRACVRLYEIVSRCHAPSSLRHGGSVPLSRLPVDK
jgi:hypothetical protein